MSVIIDWQALEKIVNWEVLGQKQATKDPTLFEIAGFPHYELAISNFYSYYFDIYQPHGFSDLFINSLISIIGKKTNKEFNFDINSFNTYREVRTNKGKLIDILLIEGPKDEDFLLTSEYESAIVIEVKIYADVYNELGEYYNSINSPNKLGVVLGIKEYDIKHANYISITHEELLNEVTSQSLSYLLNTTERQITIFRDFVYNIQQLYTDNNMNMEIEQHIEFFFNNGDKVKQMFLEYNNLLLHINKTIESVAIRNGFTIMTKRGSAKKTSVFGISDTSLNWYIYLENIVFEKSFNIELWIQQSNDDVQKWKSQDSTVTDEFNRIANSKKIGVNNSSVGDKNHWRKIATKGYAVSEDELKSFDTYFEGIIKEDWLELKSFVLNILK